MNDSPEATAGEKPKRKFPLVPVLIGAGILLILISVTYFLVKSQTGDDQVPTLTGEPSGGGPFVREVSVVKTGAKYKAITAKPTGWFTTGQEADIVLSAFDFNNSGGPLLFHHPGTAASDGTHLLMADKNNNRILIWNSLPTKNTPPDLVLGQKNFTTNNPGVGADGMNWPISVSTGGGKVAVADAYNDRILLWTSFPTTSGQPADFIINGLAPQDPRATSKRTFGWPWGVWTDGVKLALASTFGGNVLLWNTFPTADDQAADISLDGGGKMGTPRTVTSDGNSLIIGDHNARIEDIDASGMGSMIGNFFWKSWPAKDNTPYDFYMSDPDDSRGAWMQGGFAADGKLVMIGSKLHIWNSFPQSAADKPDLSVGPVEPPPPPPPLDRSNLPQIPEGGVQGVTSFDEGYEFKGGDGSGLAIAGDRIYISLSNANKIVAYNSLPTEASAVPDFAIGSSGAITNSLDENYLITNPVPATDGQSLFVSSDFDRKLYVWKKLPDESGAHPDYVYSLPEAPWDNTLYGNVLALAGRNSVYIWKDLPTDGGLPDTEIVDEIGGVKLLNLQGVAYDGTYFYLADFEAGKIYVWERVPDENTVPTFTVDLAKPMRLSSDGEYLTVVADTGPGWSVYAYRVADLRTNPKPMKIDPHGRAFNLPQKAEVYAGSLIVGDTSNNQIRIWKDIGDALAGKTEDLMLGETDPTDTRPEIGKSKTFWPACPAFDGSYLWLGEFKFSGRLLRYSAK